MTMSGGEIVTRGSESESFEDHEARENSAEPTAPPETASESSESDEKLEEGEKSGSRGRRAHSQDATPADVPRIRQLTAQKHEERQAREAAEARIAALEAKIAELTAAAPKPPDAPAGFTLEKPDLTKYVAANKTYEDWLEDTVEWRIAKKDFERDQAAATQKAEQSDKRAAEKAHSDFRERAAKFAEEHPDYSEVVKTQDNVIVPALLNTVLVTDDNGPAFVYHLAQHPDALAELILLTDGRSVTQDSVATVRRLLSSRLAAASTGSAATAPVRRVASPPNPVRTGAQTPAASDPTDSESFEAHEARENARDRDRRRAR